MAARWTPHEGEQLEIGQEAPPIPPPRHEGVPEGRRRRDAGAGQASANTWSPWRAKFEAALEQCARSGREFVSDDVLAICGEPLASSANSVGALLGGAAKRGLIVCVGVRTSGRPSRHGGLVRRWRGA